MTDLYRDSRIADDWLEVDDAASVVSLSSFDEAALSQPTSPLLKPSRSPDLEASDELPRTRYSVSPEPKLLLHPECTRKVPDLIDAAPTSITSSASKDTDAHDAEEAGTTTDAKAPVVPAPVPAPVPVPAPAIAPPPPAAPTNPSTPIDIINTISSIDRQQQEQHFPDPWPVDQENVRDPHFYHKTLCAAIESIEATATQALELGASRISTLSFLKSTCDELAKHARQLEPILGGYSKRWRENGPHPDPRDVPLNPSLLEWISHLRMQLLNSRVEMNKISVSPSNPDERPRSLKAKSIPLHVNVALAGCAEALEDALSTIEDFMPIFKTDFDEALTRGMNIPSREIGQVTTTPRREPPHPDVARLRRELYSLKDQLRQLTAMLSVLCTPKCPEALPEAPYLIQGLERIVESISTILTNHASEWFESTLAPAPTKVITYQQFLALEPDLLHDLAGRLQQIHDDLVMDRSDWELYYTEEMVRNHQIVLLAEGGILKEIVSTAELLESLVFPEK